MPWWNPFSWSDDDERRERQKQDRENRENIAKREAATAMESYKQQQAAAEKAIAERKAQQDMEKRVINEKQIRSLRASFRRPGIMEKPGGTQSANEAAPSAGTMQPMEASK